MHNQLTTCLDGIRCIYMVVAAERIDQKRQCGRWRVEVFGRYAYGQPIALEEGSCPDGYGAARLCEQAQKVVVVGEKDQVDRAKAASEKVWTGPPGMEEAGCAKLRRRCNRVPAFALLDPRGILATAM